MNQAEYNQLISQTFCENAIRTVMLIDDEYVPYSKLVKLSLKSKTIEELQEQLASSERAASIQNYFESKKLICDVSDGFTNFDAEKARKSDLIILDYFLENNDPKRTIQILNDLVNSNHLNLVALYTNKSLEDSWLQVVTSLLGCGEVDFEDLIEDENPREFWNDKTNSGTEIPDNWHNTITNNDVANFLLRKRPEPGTIRKIIEQLDPDQKKNRSVVYTGICHDKLITSELDLLGNDKFEGEFCGNFSGSKWLKIGNLFLCFSDKNVDVTGEDIYKTLNKALVDWNPNYFRLVLSEIENQLENEGVSISNFSKDDYLEQAAWLWQILSSSSKLNISDLISQNQSKITSKLLNNDGLTQFSNKVLDCMNDEFPQQEKLELQTEEQNKDEYKIYKDNLTKANLQVVDTQIRKTLSDTHSAAEKQPSKVVIAMNKSLSLKAISTDHITTGTILSDETKSHWYLCVSPACDCVPEQNNTNLTKRLAPGFKPLKFLELTVITEGSALKSATDGKYLFLPDDVILQVEGEPKLDYVIVHNKAEEALNFKVSFLECDESELTTAPQILTVYAQLKEEYAARFQALASHHVGRIGVDFINYVAP